MGDFDLAAHWAGFETVAFCEQNKFCQKVLNKHWPEVPIYDDIFTLTAESLERRGIRTDEIKLISGGFPCQPYSHAGKRLGNEDDRALWPEMLRVIREVKPVYVLGENVPGLVSLALDGVLSDLAKEGYETGVYVLPACAVNAQHRRDRVFIIAHSNSTGRKEQHIAAFTGGNGYPTRLHDSETLADTASLGRIGQPNIRWENGYAEGENRTAKEWGGDWLMPDMGTTAINRLGTKQQVWDSQPDVLRVVNGVPDQLDRLKALGNAVVPQQVYPILKAIADYERGR